MALAACGQSSKASGSSDNAVDSIAENDKQETKVLKPKVSLAFVGDVMMGTTFPQGGRYITADRGKSLFKDCKEYIREADIAIANLEGTIYDGNAGELRKMTNPNTYYIFRMPADHAQHLVDAGFDAVGIANNHSNDFGPTGRKLSMQTLDSVGIKYSGVKKQAEVCLMEKDGVKYAFAQFAASCTNVLDMLDGAEVDSVVTAARKQCDVLIITFHGGAEGRQMTHVPRATEWYVGEERGNVYEFAHHCIDLGADIVVGSGPHVPRGLELYNGHLIAYSLGNFCAPYRLGTGGTTGLAPLLVAELNTEDGTFVGGNIHSYIQVPGVGPRTDANKAAARLMRTLSQQDFPQSGLEISEDGVLTKK